MEEKNERAFLGLSERNYYFRIVLCVTGFLWRSGVPFYPFKNKLEYTIINCELKEMCVRNLLCEKLHNFPLFGSKVSAMRSQISQNRQRDWNECMKKVCEFTESGVEHNIIDAHCVHDIRSRWEKIASLKCID